MRCRVCTVCGVVVSPDSTCRSCRAVKARRRAATRGAAPGDRAAVKLRRAVNSAGGGRCRSCQVWCQARDLEVDHVRPLADGGWDVAANLQLLCRPCHRTKTADEARARWDGG